MRNRHLSAVALLAAALLICYAPASRAQAVATADGADTTDAGDFYSCPMHPEVRSKKKGRCPKCKMDLRLTHARPKPSDEGMKAGVTEATPTIASAAAEDARGAYGSSKMT